MSAIDNARQIVFTNKAQCRDCYRCVRVCPVKAIRMHAGQANVVEERCIACGTCVRECPQSAKQIRHDLERTLRLFAPGVKVAASVAPSFASVFPKWQQARLASALRQLGFAYVGETAIGAYHVAQQTKTLVESRPGQYRVATACPAVVDYVERYRPDLVSYLVPVVSTMIAHAKHIRATLEGQVRVVFIGPCVAKKAEADRPELAGLVDAVLTFNELEEWMARREIDLSACEESAFDEQPAGDARLFPLEGGSLRTAGYHSDLLAADVLATSGFDEICLALGGLGQPGSPAVIEPLFCPQGCIHGPAIPSERNPFLRRSDLLHYAEAHPGGEEDAAYRADLNTRFTARGEPGPEVTEERIRQVLEMTGKAAQSEQLNCAACGYPSCREKAIAVIRGLAEPEMCLPRMRRLAEQRVDKIVESSPNGIVILDEQLKILHMNPAFRRFFMCSEAVCGMPISYLVDPEPFERLAAGQETLIEGTVEHKRYNLVCHQIAYVLKEEKQYVGIFVNVTDSRTSQEKLDQLRSQTVVQARELLEHQIRMADTLARFLGESTARGEDLVEKLMLLAEGQTDAGGKRGQWLRDMYTSK